MALSSQDLVILALVLAATAYYFASKRSAGAPVALNGSADSKALENDDEGEDAGRDFVQAMKNAVSPIFLAATSSRRDHAVSCAWLGREHVACECPASASSQSCADSRSLRICAPTKAACQPPVPFALALVLHGTRKSFKHTHTRSTCLSELGAPGTVQCGPTHHAHTSLVEAIPRHRGPALLLVPAAR